MMIFFFTILRLISVYCTNDDIRSSKESRDSEFPKEKETTAILINYRNRERIQPPAKGGIAFHITDSDVTRSY